MWKKVNTGCVIFCLSAVVLIALMLGLGVHGDNWSVVVIRGQIIDSNTRQALNGVGYTPKYWVSGSEFSEQYEKDPDSVEIEMRAYSDEDGRFELRPSLHWAVYFIPFMPSYYQPYDIFLRQVGYQDRVVLVENVKVRVKRRDLPPQVIDIGQIELSPKTD